MKLSRLEKWYVNSKFQTKNNIKIADYLLSKIDLANVNEVLEVGCGTGVLSHYLTKKYGWNVTGIDLDTCQLEKAKENESFEKDRLKFFEADATQLPFENNQFDLVLSFDVLHHILDWEKAIKEINRALKPSGVYFLNDLALSKVLSKLFKGLLKNYMSVFTINDIIEGIIKNNFELKYEERPLNIIARHFSLVALR